MSVLDSSVLVLNASWSAVHIASVRRAISLVYQGLAQFVSPEDFNTYDFDSWRELSRVGGSDTGCVRSIDFTLRVPEVIRLPHFNGRQRRKIRFTRRNLFERDACTCQYCGVKLPVRELTLDHVVPRCHGGRSTWENLAVACVKCNSRKANRMPHEAGMRLLRQPTKPRWPAYLAVRMGPVRRASWQRFIDAAYWDSELKE
jgi:5-methylcytosine-specific restriction endonuclease McrA